MPQFDLYPQATSLTGNEIFLIAQNNNSANCTLRQIANVIPNIQGPGVLVGSGVTAGATSVIIPNLPQVPLQTSSYRVTGQFNGQSETTGDLVSFDFSALYKRIGTGNLTLVGTYNSSQFYADLSVAPATVTTTTGGGNAPLISVNGVSGISIDWNWTLQIVQGV
jgi:hypothetical protein